MRISFDVTLKEDGHDIIYKCSKLYGVELRSFNPKKSIGCLLLAFEYLADIIGYPDTEAGKDFRKWVADEKTKYGVK